MTTYRYSSEGHSQVPIWSFGFPQPHLSCHIIAYLRQVHSWAVKQLQHRWTPAFFWKRSALQKGHPASNSIIAGMCWTVGSEWSSLMLHTVFITYYLLNHTKSFKSLWSNNITVLLCITLVPQIPGVLCRRDPPSPHLCMRQYIQRI